MCSLEEGLQLGMGSAVPDVGVPPKCMRNKSVREEGPANFSESIGHGCPMAKGLGASSN